MQQKIIIKETSLYPLLKP